MARGNFYDNAGSGSRGNFFDNAGSGSRGREGLGGAPAGPNRGDFFDNAGSGSRGDFFTNAGGAQLDDDGMGIPETGRGDFFTNAGGAQLDDDGMGIPGTGRGDFFDNAEPLFGRGDFFTNAGGAQLDSGGMGIPGTGTRGNFFDNAGSGSRGSFFDRAGSGSGMLANVPPEEDSLEPLDHDDHHTGPPYDGPSAAELYESMMALVDSRDRAAGGYDDSGNPMPDWDEYKANDPYFVPSHGPGSTFYGPKGPIMPPPEIMTEVMETEARPGFNNLYGTKNWSKDPYRHRRGSRFYQDYISKGKNRGFSRNNSPGYQRQAAGTSADAVTDSELYRTQGVDQNLQDWGYSQGAMTLSQIIGPMRAGGMVDPYDPSAPT